MAFTTPGTAVAGEVLTAAFWNEQVRDNLNALDAAGANDVGLVHITSQSFTSVSSVNVNNCFSADFQNYKVLFSIPSGSSMLCRFRLRAGGTDATAAQYDIQTLIGQSGTAAAGRTNAATSWIIHITGTVDLHAVMYVYRPFLAQKTFHQRTVYQDGANGAATSVDIGGGGHRAATSFDGFTIFDGTNMTGNLRVYGLRD